jgi:chemotaxis protein histidine kinase CheA
MANPKVEFIDPRDAAPRTARLGKPVFDDSALTRADDAMKAMSGAFGEWLDADMAKLQAARLDAEHAAWSNQALDTLFAAAHDVKGMGATYGYPLATQLAASLCRLIETDAGKAAARQLPALVCAHVDALRAIVRDGVKSSGDPMGRALLQALEQQVDALGVGPE